MDLVFAIAYSKEITYSFQKFKYHIVIYAACGLMACYNAHMSIIQAFAAKASFGSLC